MKDPEQLHYIVNHVFLPPKLPQECDESPENYSALCRTIFECASKYRRFIAEDVQPLWDKVLKMLDSLCTLEREGFSREEVENRILRLDCDGRQSQYIEPYSQFTNQQIFLPYLSASKMPA
jgi:hypothetical protein